jgi:hypothetical protein
MKANLILVVSILLSVLSCTSKQENVKLKELEVYPDGSVLQRKFTKQGILFAEILRKNGKKNGVSRNFYEDGKIKIETNFIENSKEGESKLYYPEGGVCQLNVFKNDVLNGVTKYFYKNGSLSCEIPYLNGEAEPGLKEYSKEGKVISESPEIIVTPIDKTTSSNKYILRLSLSNKSQNVSFARVYFEKKKKTKVEIRTKNGVGELSFNISPDVAYRENVIVEASYKTKYGNPYVARSTYTLLIGKNAN